MGFDVGPVAGVVGALEGRGEGSSVVVLEVAVPTDVALQCVDHDTLVPGSLGCVIEGKEEFEPSAVRGIVDVVKLGLDISVRVDGVLVSNIEGKPIYTDCRCGTDIAGPVVLSITISVSHLIIVSQKRLGTMPLIGTHYDVCKDSFALGERNAGGQGQ